MKENTRKSLAIWMLGGGIVILGLGNYIPSVAWLKVFGMDISEISTEYWGVVNSSVYLCINLIVGCFWYGGILILKKLLNTVTCKFFNRLIIGFIIIPVGFGIVDVIGFLVHVSGMPTWFPWIILFTMAEMIVVMSGAGIVRKNYILDTYLASKLRLFQTGILLGGSGFVISVLWWYFQNVGMEFRELSLMLNPMQYVNMVVYIAGYVCLFLGLKGIIQSDLLGENRKEDVFENVGGGWGERPVIGVVGYCAFLLIFTILAFQTVVTY